MTAWLVPMVFVGGVGGAITGYHPLVEPLWLHFVLVSVVPFACGFAALALLTRHPRRSPRGPGERPDGDAPHPR